MRTLVLRYRRSSAFAKQWVYVFAYSLVSIVLLRVICSVFETEEKVWLWSVDGVMQHYNSYRVLIEFIESRFSESFNFSIGFGNDIFYSLNGYDITDPICWATAMLVFYPRITRYTLNICIKIYLAGLGFSAMCFASEVKRPRRYVLLGSLIYAFSGMTFYLSTHPNFLTGIYCLPFIIAGIERMRNRKRSDLFIFFVALNCIANFYTLYINVVIVIVYVVLDFIVRCVSSKNARDNFLFALRVGICGVFGCLLGAVVLFPTLYASSQGFSQSGLNGVYETLFKYDDVFFYQLLKSVFSPLYSAPNRTSPGVVPFAFVPIVLYLLNRKTDKLVKLITGVLFLFMLFPVFGALMNGFRYPCNRFCYAFVLFIAIAAIDGIPLIKTATSRESFLVFAAAVCYVILALIYSADNSSTDIIYMLVGILSSVLALAWIRTQGKGDDWLVSTGVVGIMFVWVFVYTLYPYPSYGGNRASQHLRWTDVSKNFDMVPDEMVEIVNDGTNTRTAMNINMTSNIEFPNEIMGTSYWWSMMPESLHEYAASTGLITMTQNCNIKTGLDVRPGLMALASVKYYLSTAGNSSLVPYNYTDLDPEDEFKYSLYENPTPISLGYAYKSYISDSSVSSLTAYDLEYAMLNGAQVSDADAASLEAAGLSSGSYSSAFKKTKLTLESAESVNTDSIDSGKLRVSGADGYILYSATIPEGSQAYLYFDNMSLVEDDELVSQVAIEINASDEDTSVSKKTVVDNSYSVFNVERENSVINLGCNLSGACEIKLTFSCKCTLKYSDIRLVTIPTEEIQSMISALGEYQLENVSIESDTVTGTITVPDTRFLQFSIPYSEGWTLWVDGVETPLVKSSIVFMGATVDSGTHDIVLEYHTPYMRTGLCVSCVAFVLYIGICVVESRKSKNTAK